MKINSCSDIHQPAQQKKGILLRKRVFHLLEKETIMKELKHILVPVDFSATAMNAARYAIWFADHYGAKVHLLHVVYPEANPSDFPTIAGKATQDKIAVAKEALSSFVNLTMTQVQAGHQLRNVPDVRSDVQIGTPSAVIAKTTASDDPDLIVMGTQGEHSLLERAFGSVTTNTISKTSCPVLVVPEEAQWNKINTVAYATDLRESDPWHIWESARLLDPFHPLLRIVHITTSPEEEQPVQMDELKEFFANRSPAVQTTFHTVSAVKIMTEITEFVDTWDADLLVMYRPQRTLFANLFHVSLTKKTALHSKVPLLVLRS
jgi:nucleotide-binding universal stress UspA family protein